MLVVDASVVLAWAIPDEQDDFALRALDATERDGAIAPALLRYEVANVLASLRRRGRLTAMTQEGVFAAIEALAIRLVPPEASDWFARTGALAHAYALSAYDAAYLSLACATSLPLATLDARLAAAATAERRRWS